MTNKSKYYKGMDVSTLPEIERLGGRFYQNGVERDLLDILGDCGTNAIRVRLWNNPYSEQGEAYGAGTNDLKTAEEIIRRARAKGFTILLDYHYSDFWADPGKQTIPKAWKDFDVKQLEKAVYEYTYETLCYLQNKGLLPEMVQVGNELSNGLLWPYGKVPNYDNIARFVNAGIRAVRRVSEETASDIRIMLHLDNGGNNHLYREWFDHFLEKGEDFDIIGLSYYPFWHGTFDMLEQNMCDIAKRYKKELIIAEVSTGFTMQSYADYERLDADKRKGMATGEELVKNVEYPMTPKGQQDFLKELFMRLESVPDGLGRGFFYWEPGWLPVKGSGWANDSALSYIHEKGPGGNEWANQALFDYNGNALPALFTIRDYVPT